MTGANTGIGYGTARALAHKGADVALACRSREKGEAAAARVAAEQPSGSVAFAALDLADLDSVRSFTGAFTSTHDRLDILINNAAVMVPPESTTKQGFELQFGVNHLGHFALTGLLLDLLRVTPGARVVTVSSAAHRMGTMDFDDVNFTARGYNPWGVYGQSKLANPLFTFELQRRLSAGSLNVIAAAAYPGWTGTDLQRHAWYMRLLNVFFAMSPALGALPTRRDATIRGHVFCSFLALVLRKELQDRLERKGWRVEWADVIADLDQLLEMEISIQGKGYIIRSEIKGTEGKVAQACAVALPPELRPCGPAN